MIFTHHSLPRPQHRALRFVFIFLSWRRKSKEDCIYKRECKSKSITIPVRLMACFAFLFLLPFLSVDKFAQLKWATGGQHYRERKGLHKNLTILMRAIRKTSPSTQAYLYMILKSYMEPKPVRNLQKHPSSVYLPHETAQRVHNSKVTVDKPWPCLWSGLTCEPLPNPTVMCCCFHSRWLQQGHRSEPFTTHKLVKGVGDGVLIDRCLRDLSLRSLIDRWCSYHIPTSMPP